jgi:hypothetical protein
MLSSVLAGTRSAITQLFIDILEDFGSTKPAHIGGEPARRVCYLVATVRRERHVRRIIQRTRWPRFVDHSPGNLAQMTILCAWCERPIFVFDEVSLEAHPRPGAFAMTEYAAQFSDGRYVGCMHCHVPLEGSDRGTWMPCDRPVSTGRGYRYVGGVRLVHRPHLILRPERMPTKFPDVVAGFTPSQLS